MSVTASLAAKLSNSLDINALADLASKALEEGEEELALPLIERGAVELRNTLLWQWKALLERSLDEHDVALRSFEEAARLDPESGKELRRDYRTGAVTAIEDDLQVA